MTLPVWGVPWHGLVQGGQLQLPNGTTRTWPQPDGTSSGSITDHAGYTFLQKLPGVAEIERTPEEQAADEEAGMEWRDNFIVSGTDTSSSASAVRWPQIHSKQLGGWIYAAPGGGRWLVKGGGTYNFSQGGTLNIPLRLVKFGDFGGAPVTINLTVSATSAAMGQLTPSVSSTALRAKVEDISPAGDRAIVMLYLGNKTPIGFLLLTLTGTPGMDFVAALSVLKTRAQTLGSRSESDTVSIAKLVAWYDLPSVVEDNRGTYPSCGYVDTIYTPTAYLRPPEGGQSPNVTVGSGEHRIDISGRVLAMWFDQTGNPQPLELNSQQRYSIDGPAPTHTVTGRVVRRTSWYPNGGTCSEGTSSYLEYLTREFSYSTAEMDEQIATLTYGEASVTVSFRRERTVSYEEVYTGAGDGFSPPVAYSFTSTERELITVDGVVEQDVTVTLPGAPFVGYPPDLPYGQDNIPRLDDMTLSSRGGGWWGLSLKRWANNLIGWRNTSASASTTYTASPALSPLSICSPSDPAATGLYGSLNPLSGEAIFPSATPVSWT